MRPNCSDYVDLSHDTWCVNFKSDCDNDKETSISLRCKSETTEMTVSCRLRGQRVKNSLSGHRLLGPWPRACSWRCWRLLPKNPWTLRSSGGFVGPDDSWTKLQPALQHGCAAARSPSLCCSFSARAEQSSFGGRVFGTMEKIGWMQ